MLPVGGIKEKMLAAHRAGIKRVVLPERNEKDVVDVPEEVRDEMEFVFAKSVDVAVDAILEPQSGDSGGSSESAAGEEE